MSIVELSVKVPKAVKLVVKPFATDAVVGLIAIELRTGEVTIKVAIFEVMPFEEAVTDVLP